MKIKICGLFRLDDVDFVNEALPDYAGFVFAKSRRMVDRRFAKEMRARLSRDITAAGVFVDSEIDEIASVCEDKSIEIIQLHGQEDAEYIARLKKRLGLPIVKAVRVEQWSDVEKAAALSPDYLLLDGGEGGTGRAFDWLKIQSAPKPFFLAGGINAGNIAAALVVKPAPFALDISTGAETDGVKDKAKIFSLVQSVRKGERI